MSDDLISREALKKTIEEAFEKANLSDYEACVCVCEIYDKQIDNAPTVEIIDYDTGYQDGLEDGLNDIRPQGEWQLHGMIYYCSECGHECGESGDNFCGNCGADMRGKK